MAALFSGLLRPQSPLLSGFSRYRMLWVQLASDRASFALCLGSLLLPPARNYCASANKKELIIQAATNILDPSTICTGVSTILVSQIPYARQYGLRGRKSGFRVGCRPDRFLSGKLESVPPAGLRPAGGNPTSGPEALLHNIRYNSDGNNPLDPSTVFTRVSMILGSLIPCVTQ